MLGKIELTYFRRHESLAVDFREGLNVIRASNEGGKTTLLEAISYALFGSKVLRNSLADTVTWGHKENKLKVSVEYGDVVITRSKGGAEVSRQGQVLVTGQTEVTRFCEGLLGADANLAMNLMFAGQTKLRGVLEAGPKATADLIETLGDFDLFDRLLDAAENRLSLGSTATAAERLKGLEAQIEATPSQAAPDRSAFESARAHLQARIAEAQAEHATQVAQANEARSGLAEARQKRQTADQMLQEVQRLEGLVTSAQTELARTREEASGEVQDTAPLAESIRAAGDRVKQLKAYEAFCRISPVRGVREDRLMATTRRAELQAQKQTLTSETFRLVSDAKVALAKKTSSSICGICGIDVSTYPEVAERNKVIDQETRRLHEAYSDACTRLQTVTSELEVLDQIFVEDADLRARVQSLGIGSFVDLDDLQIPAGIYWKGAPPNPNGPDVAALQEALRGVTESNNRLIGAKARLESLDAQVKRLQESVVERQEALQKALHNAHQDLDALQAEYEAKEALARQTQDRVMDLTLEMGNLEREFSQQEQTYANVQARVMDLRNLVTSTKSEIAATEFNNALVKKIRAARPTIANKLWSMVLASVSTLFSNMRGEQSVVSKDKSGFVVNGNAVESLSGSTLDILGLAIRSALIKTFVPNCPLLVLDEPSQGCDQDRTNAMLGFIAGSGFKQVLVVTHNNGTESFANHVVRF